MKTELNEERKMHVHFSRFVVSLAVSAVLFAGTVAFGGIAPNQFHWSGRVAAGQTLEIKGVNGNIHAEPALGKDVDVIAYRSGTRYDPTGLEVKVMEHDGGVTVCAVLPAMRDCSLQSNDSSIDFVVRVPKGVRFVARTVNGLVEAKSLDGDTEAHTVNGNLSLSTAGTAQGETVNGSIVASMGKVSSPLNFSTVNGGITLTMPSSSEAQVHANTLKGRICTNFPLTVEGSFAGQQMNGSLGRGGPELRIATVNGSINLRHGRIL